MNIRTISLLSLGMMLFAGATELSAQSGQSYKFSEASLIGCYGAREQGDGGTAAGLGIICYDGAGNTTRSLTVNAPDGEGGRRILKFTSEGTYTVNPDGTGTATHVNQISNGEETTDTFDIVITETTVKWIPGRGLWRVASEIFGAQREAGVTVSLVTSIQKRIADSE